MSQAEHTRSETGGPGRKARWLLGIGLGLLVLISLPLGLYLATLGVHPFPEAPEGVRLRPQRPHPAGWDAISRDNAVFYLLQISQYKQLLDAPTAAMKTGAGRRSQAGPAALATQYRRMVDGGPFSLDADKALVAWLDRLQPVWSLCEKATKCAADKSSLPLAPDELTSFSGKSTAAAAMLGSLEAMARAGGMTLRLDAARHDWPRFVTHLHLLFGALGRADSGSAVLPHLIVNAGVNIIARAGIHALFEQPCPAGTCRKIQAEARRCRKLLAPLPEVFRNEYCMQLQTLKALRSGRGFLGGGGGSPGKSGSGLWHRFARKAGLRLLLHGSEDCYARLFSLLIQDAELPPWNNRYGDAAREFALEKPDGMEFIALAVRGRLLGTYLARAWSQRGREPRWERRAAWLWSGGAT